MQDFQDASTVAAKLGLPPSAPIPEAAVAESSSIVVTLRTDTQVGQQIAGLVSELGLSEHLHSTDALKAELQKIIFALHPDKSGGAFQSEQEEARFLKARRVVELLDAPPTGDADTEKASLPATPRAIPDGRAPVRPSRALHRLHMRAMTHARADRRTFRGAEDRCGRHHGGDGGAGAAGRPLRGQPGAAAFAHRARDVELALDAGSGQCAGAGDVLVDRALGQATRGSSAVRGGAGREIRPGPPLRASPGPHRQAQRLGCAAQRRNPGRGQGPAQASVGISRRAGPHDAGDHRLDPDAAADRAQRAERAEDGFGRAAVPGFAARDGELAGLQSAR